MERGNRRVCLRALGWIHGSRMSPREDGSWPREDEQPWRRLEVVVGKGTEAGKAALTLPSVRPSVGFPSTSSSSVPPRVCHHRHRLSVCSYAGLPSWVTQLLPPWS
ncbi:hypothetical protein KM043_009780 [Ampulex compressa]|nr:hypothetical protein KM043_009780 [Ampulex compressa]